MTRVHVVVHKVGADQILSRQGHYLAKHNFWSISEKPDENADINLFCPYIIFAQDFPDWKKTKIASYFTHHDFNHKQKSDWWKYAAKNSDFGFATTLPNVRELKKLGLERTYYATPPIDDLFFNAEAKDKDVAQVVGLSGVVYGDGRKGENIVANLAKKYEAKGVKFIATGRGWPAPIETKWWNWEEMPWFYDSIDVFLCTSNLEGIPMPPLEALARGAILVVPKGVGMLDELPTAKGIFHYNPSSERSLQLALNKALKLKTQEGYGERKKAAEAYREGFWALDYKSKLASDMKKAPETKKPTTKSKTIYQAEKKSPTDLSRCAMYCVAFGEPARKCAITCIESFKKWMPRVEVIFGGTEPIGHEDAFIELFDQDIGGRKGKLTAFEATRDYDHVLYLDADTETVGDLTPLYEFLDSGWDMLICKDMSKYHVARMMRRPDNGEEFEETMTLLGTGEVMQYNGGVFGFSRSEKMQELFDVWNDEWERWRARDQGALLRALYKVPVKMLTLTNVWNATDRYRLPKGDVAILHHNMNARRWDGLIYGPTDDEAAWERVAEWEKKHGTKASR